jgi:hypothetical protein
MTSRKAPEGLRKPRLSPCYTKGHEFVQAQTYSNPQQYGLSGVMSVPLVIFCRKCGEKRTL